MTKKICLFVAILNSLTNKENLIKSSECIKYGCKFWTKTKKHYDQKIIEDCAIVLATKDKII